MKKSVFIISFLIPVLLTGCSTNLTDDSNTDDNQSGQMSQGSQLSTTLNDLYNKLNEGS